MGDESLREMSDVRHVSVDRIATSDDPLWCPYTEKSLSMARKATHLLLGGGSLLKKLSQIL